MAYKLFDDWSLEILQFHTQQCSSHLVVSDGVVTQTMSSAITEPTNSFLLNSDHVN